MPTNNAINLKDQGLAYYDGAGLFSAPLISEYYVIVGAENNSLNGVAPGTAGYALVSGGPSANPSYAILGVEGGGTGLDSLTPYALMAGGTSSTGDMQQVASLGSVGQVLTSSGASALPVWSSLPANNFPWSVVTSATQALAVNNGYIAVNPTVAVVFSLPATSAVGTLIRIAGRFTGSGWQVNQGSGQYIQMGSSASTPGISGYIGSTDANDVVELLCVEADLGWVVLSAIGNIKIN